MMAELPLKVAEFRARDRECNISPGYRGWLHFAMTNIAVAWAFSFVRLQRARAGSDQAPR